MDEFNENNSWVQRDGYWRTVKGNIEFTIEYRMGYKVISAWSIDYRLLAYVNVTPQTKRDLFRIADKFVMEFIAQREGGSK